MKHSASALLLLFAQILTPAASSAAVQGCAHEIVLLPQTHASTGNGRLYSEDVSRSQFAIAKFMQDHAELPFFSEGAFNNIVVAQRRPGPPEVEKNVADARRIFADGFRGNFEDLTDEQKQILSKWSADILLGVTNVIPEIHRVAPDAVTELKVQKTIEEYFAKHPNEKIIPGSTIYNMIFPRRERLALREINDYFTTHPEQKRVALVFGSLHTFQAHSDLFPAACVKTPFELQTQTPQKKISQQPLSAVVH